MSSDHPPAAREISPEPQAAAGHDRIPVLTEPVSPAPAAADSDLDALTERVLDEIEPALHAAIAAACENYLATREARTD